jgi:hypothetical protein
MAERAPIEKVILLAVELPAPVTLPEAPTRLETVIPRMAMISVTNIHSCRE